MARGGATGAPVSTTRRRPGATARVGATVPAESITAQHYAFLISDEEFDLAFARIRQAGVAYYADPRMQQPGEINHHHGGRGLYFLDPSGHGLEIITRPYGSHATAVG